MKLSELSRYWAAKELTQIEIADEAIHFQAPFSCPDFTVAIPKGGAGNPIFTHGKSVNALKEVASQKRLESNTWCNNKERLIACFDLPKGKSMLVSQR